MHFLVGHKWLSAVLTGVALLAAFALWQVLYITHHYTASVPAPAIPRSTEHFGDNGPLLRFVVLGDSTSIGQGAPYDKGIAHMSAMYLAGSHRVELTNFGVSGARVADVRFKQLNDAAALKPDVVLIAVGANDVTHLTRLGSVRSDTTAILTALQTANPAVQIVLTGSPAMGSVARFAPPTQWAAAVRVRQINGVFADLLESRRNVVLVPLAKETGPIFKHNPVLFAADNFHPNATGYVVWQTVITAGFRSLDESSR
jgi:lysophospholipase L1-like esterase